MRRLRFAADVQCPYAYLASRRVRQVAEAAHATVEHFPVLLGGLYADTKAPQGKDGSATDVMGDARRMVSARDLAREVERWGVPFKYNAKHPVRSVKAQRVLAAVDDLTTRGALMDALFEAYWALDQDVSDDGVLLRIVGAFLPHVDSVSKLDALAESAKDRLRANTTWASQRGAFGVPTFWIMNQDGSESERFWFGQDRTFLVARALGAAPTHPLANPLRLHPDTRSIRTGGGAQATPTTTTLEFFHDFSSPWSYLGSTQIARIAEKHKARLVLRPILLGAVFKQINTPNVPMFAMSDAKRAYMARDMEDWKAWWTPEGVTLRFPDKFPLRTVLPLRVAIVEPRVTTAIYRAAWVNGLDVGDASVLRTVLTDAGFDGAALVARGESDAAAKAELQRNTSEAVARGLCGVPSCSVNGSEVVWGQDRFNVVEDMLVAAASGGGSKL